jgi:c-di-GMP-binding flagellar brake protein YcgR
VAVTTRFRVRSGSRESAYIEGRTRDLSASGLALETKTIRVDGIHAYDSMDMVTPTRLDIVLGLPTGTVAITGETVRYDKLEDGVYLLGVRIVEISDADRQRYLQFVEKLKG